MKPRICKQILGNIIKHVDNHNRILEEDECWRLHTSNKLSSLNHSNKEGFKPSRYSASNVNRNGLKPSEETGRSGLNALQSRGVKRAYMDDDESTKKCTYVGREEKSNFWMKKFDLLESSLGYRWDHSGYKEMYPEEFEEKEIVSNIQDTNYNNEQKYCSHKSKKHKKSRRYSIEEEHSNKPHHLCDKVKHKKHKTLRNTMKEKKERHDSDAKSQLSDANDLADSKDDVKTEAGKVKRSLKNKHVSLKKDSFSSNNSSISDYDEQEKFYKKKHKHKKSKIKLNEKNDKKKKKGKNKLKKHSKKQKAFD